MFSIDDMDSAVLNRHSSPSRSVQSVDRSLDILETLGRAANGLGVTELARALGLKPPTTHNLLRTLTARGYVAQDGRTQKYSLGAGCVVLGRMCQRSLRVPVVAQPHLMAISAKLNESAVLGMMEHGEIAFVARVEADRMLTVNFHQVWVPDSYSSVCGRVLLAHLSPDALKSYIKSHPIAKSKAEDIRSKKALMHMLAEIRRQGHCAYWRDKDTVFAIAAPAFNADGKAVAAVGVPVPGMRVSEQNQPQIIQAVCETTRRISYDLGWRPESPAQR